MIRSALRLPPLASLTLCALAAGAAWSAQGCQTVERIDGVEYPVSDEPKENEREQALLAAVEEDEKNLPAWFALGEHYERYLRYRESYMAFARFQKGLAWEEDRIRRPLRERETLGLDALARLALRLGSTDAAEAHLVDLLKRQPVAFAQAKRNPHFPIAHLRLAEIYFAREKYEQAHLHAMIHRELGGNQADTVLIGVENHRQREAKRAREQVVQPSLAPTQEGQAQPAGSRK